jgi:general secretion pathway protein D
LDAFKGLTGTNLIKALMAAGQTNLAERIIAGQTNLLAGGTNGPAGEEIIPAGVIRFQAADLNSVLDVYAELVQRTILRPASLPDAKITLKSQTPLTRSEAIRALEAVLNMNQITLINVGEKFVKVVTEAQAFKEAKAASDSHEVAAMDDLGPFVTVVRQLTNAKPSEVVNALQPFAKMAGGVVPIDSSGILVMRDYSDNIKRMTEMLDKIDVSIPLEVEPVVIPIKYAMAGDIAQVLGQLTAGGSVSTTGGSSGASRGLSKSSSSSNRGNNPYGNVPGSPGYNPNNPSGTMGGITPTGTPGSAQAGFADRLRSIVSKAAGTDIQVLGEAKIIADERMNALLVFANKRDRDMITNIIDKLDVVLAQVLIEALIIEVGLNDSESHGISYLQRSINKGKFTGSGAINNGTLSSLTTNTPTLPGGFSYLTQWGGDLDIAAQAVASDGRASVLSRPRIQTSHAVEANIFVGETRPYPTGNSSYYGGSFSSIQQTRIGIELAVLPLINQDGLVVMEIRQNIQNVGDSVKIDNNDVPSTIDRSASAKVAVKDKETIILGGFISSDLSRTKSGVPVLKDIPGLGVLFRSSSKKSNRKELIVFIRPTVLRTPEAASALATVERSKVSPVNQVEKQFDIDEKRRAEELQKETDKEIKKLEKKPAKTSRTASPAPVPED